MSKNSELLKNSTTTSTLLPSDELEVFIKYLNTLSELLHNKNETINSILSYRLTMAKLYKTLKKGPQALLQNIPNCGFEENSVYTVSNWDGFNRPNSTDSIVLSHNNIDSTINTIELMTEQAILHCIPHQKGAMLEGIFIKINNKE